MTENAKEVFVKTENLSQIREAEKIKEKLQIQREKRMLVDKFRNAKGLIDSDEEEDAAEWYERMKQKDQEKRGEAVSRKRSRRDEPPADDERSKRRREAMYSSKDLKGLAIGHKVDAIKEGHQVIMTLRDNDVLDEGEDVLENVNLLDDEKAAKNIENKAKKPDYKPYDDDEFDEFGILKKSSLLSKYDEEIEGPKQEMFRIGETMSNADLVRMKLQQEEEQGKISLSLPEFKVASEYYTADEMVKFKKVKRKGAMRKRNLKAAPKEEPLLPAVTEISSKSSNDHGSRSRRQQDRGRREAKSAVEEDKKVHVKLDELENDDDLDIDLVGPDEDLTGIKIEEDEAEKELYSALNKTRKLKLKEKKENDLQFDIARIVQESNDAKEEEEESITVWGTGNSLVMNTTAEFCRNLGDLPRYETSASASSKPFRDDDDDEDDVVKMEMDEDIADVDGDKVYQRNNWNEVDIKMEDEDEFEDDSNDGKPADNYRADSADELESKPILEEEPDVSVGVAGALKLAMNKGYLDKEAKKPVGTNRVSSLISAQAYAIEEKFYDDDRMGRRDRYSGQLSEFKDKEGYRPGFKLDYVDDKGRMMNQKEAFRYLSHKFHGKGPGKNKIDKRMKKMEQESKLRSMSSIDTPLNTLKMLQDKQREVKAPYVVLSGQRATSAATPITQISKKK